MPACGGKLLLCSERGEEHATIKNLAVAQCCGSQSRGPPEKGRGSATRSASEGKRPCQKLKDQMVMMAPMHPVTARHRSDQLPAGTGTSTKVRWMTPLLAWQKKKPFSLVPSWFIRLNEQHLLVVKTASP